MSTARKQLRSALSSAVDIVLPPRCAVTGDIVERQGMTTPEAWRALDFITAPFCESCGLPFEFNVQDKTLCAECLTDAPPYASARAALRYNDRSRDLILGFKHADKTHTVRAFMPWLRRAGAAVLAQADLLVPVPLHRRRLLSRRYNQAALIAFALTKETGVPCLPDALQRTRATPSQGHLTHKERHKNVRRAFALNPSVTTDIKNKTVILLDDVYTTGATVKECAKSLLKGGAAQVHVLTLARVVRPGDGN